MFYILSIRSFTRSTLIATLCMALLVFMQLPCAASTEVTREKNVLQLSGYDPIRGLGISRLECKCSYTIREDSAQGDNAWQKFWLFQSEPEIKGVDPDGPAAGILRKGDVIVGIDGLLITTRKAGVRFANIRPGEAVELTIRRGRRTLEKVITAEEDGSPGVLKVEGADTALTINLDRLYQAIEILAKGEGDLSMLVDIPELPDLIGLVDLSTGISTPDIDIHTALQDRSFMPSGWFGFSLSFSGSITSKKGEDESRWEFESPPTIRKVKDGSPADRAGLRTGDRLTHIDGVKLDSKRGGRLFSVVQPGQEVTWTVRRGRSTLDIKMTAEERPQSSVKRSKSSIPEESLEESIYQERFRGTMGKTEIEVDGDDSVVITEDKGSGEIVITARGVKVRIRKTDKE